MLTSDNTCIFVTLIQTVIQSLSRFSHIFVILVFQLSSHDLNYALVVNILTYSLIVLIITTINYNLQVNLREGCKKILVKDR